MPRGRVGHHSGPAARRYTPPVRFVRSERVLWRHASGCLVLLHPDDAGADPVTMRGLGALAWLALDRPTTLEELSALLAQVFDEPGDPPSEDVELAVDTLVDAGFVRPLA